MKRILIFLLLLVTVVGLTSCSRLSKQYSDNANESRLRSRSSSPARVEVDTVDGATIDEVWVLTRLSETDAAVTPHEEVPPSGSMMVPRGHKGSAHLVPLPLKHTSVTANITGFFATVDVLQQFHNPFGTKIEAVYVFPLPQNAAVSRRSHHHGTAGGRPTSVSYLTRQSRKYEIRNSKS